MNQTRERCGQWDRNNSTLAPALLRRNSISDRSGDRRFSFVGTFSNGEGIGGVVAYALARTGSITPPFSNSILLSRNLVHRHLFSLPQLFMHPSETCLASIPGQDWSPNISKVNQRRLLPQSTTGGHLAYLQQIKLWEA
jgi:hypothetical protein